MANSWSPGGYGWLRFGLGTLIFVISCICGLLGGFRVGYQRGAAQYIADHLETKEYGVADLVTLRPQREDVEFLESTIVNAVGGDLRSWVKWGGKGEVSFNQDHLSFVVIHTQAAHKKVEACLATVRGGESGEEDMRQFAVGDLIVSRQPSDSHDGFEYDSFLQAMKASAPPLQGYDPGRTSISGMTGKGEVTMYGSAAAQRRIARFLDAVRRLKFEHANDTVAPVDETGVH